MSAFVLDVNLRIKDVIGLQQVQQQIAGIQGQVGAGASAAGGAANAQAAAQAVAQTAAINNLSKANQGLATTSKAASTAVVATTTATTAGAKAAQNFSESIFLAGKRYAAFVTATAIPFAAIGVLTEAVQSVIEFDSSLTKLRQITGQTVEEIGGLRQRFLDLSVATGTSAVELAEASRVLAEAGIRGAELEDTLNQLAKVPLVPTFASIEEAIEGLLAVQNQFEDEALNTEQVLDVLTTVANEFAATADDLFQGFARGGAAFEAIGGTFQEFAAVLAVVRQETRESASTVGTFFKTLSSRLADPIIQDFLRGKGISLVGEEGDFVGPIEAIKRIAAELENLDDVSEKVDIANKVVGRRQVSRFLALISSLDEVDKALNVAANSSGEFNRLAEEGLTTLQNRIDRVVAQFNDLFQTLAEPVFVPFIEALTATASAAASLVEFLSPVIPIFTQIIAFGVGIKALTFSITSLTKAAAALSAVKFAGLTSLVGLGGAGKAAAGAAGAAGGAINTTGIVAANAVLGNLSEVGKNLIKSQVGQIAILGTAIGVLGHFSEEIGAAAGATGEFVSSLIQNLSGLTIGASLLTGQAPAELFRNVFSSLKGALLGISGILGTAVFTAATQAQNAIEISVKNAADKIRQLDLRTGTLDDAVAQLGEALVQGVRDAANNFRNIDTGEQSLGQFALAFGKGLTDLLTGQRGLTDDIIGEEEVNQIIDNLLGDKGEQAGVILQRAIEEFGTDFRQGLVGILSTTFGGTEQAIELANRLVQRIIESQGQTGLASAFTAASQARREAAEKAIADQAQEVVTKLRRIEVPTQLSSELTALTEAVRSTVSSIDSNVQAFNTLSSSVGRISAPNISFDVTQRAVEGLIQNQEAFQRLTGGAFGDLSEESRSFLLLKDSLTDLAQAAVAAQAQFETTGIQNLLADPQADPSKFINEIVENFIDASEDLPPGVTERLRAVGQRVISQSLEDSIFNPEIIEAALQDVAGNIGNVFDKEFGDLGGQVGSLLESSLRQAQLQIEQQSLSLETLAQRTRPEDVAQNIGFLAEQLQGIVDIPVPDLRFGDLSQQISDVAIAVGNSDQFFQAFEENARRQAESLSELSNGSAENASALLDAIPVFVESRTNINNLRATANEFVRGIDQEIQRLDQIDPVFAEQQIKGLELLRARFTQLLNEIEARAAIDVTERVTPEGTFKTAVDLFDENVRSYKLATDNLVQALRIPLTPERARQEIAQTPEQFRSAFDISAKGVQDVRIINGREIVENIPQTQGQTEALNRAAFGVSDPQQLSQQFAQELETVLARNPIFTSIASLIPGVDQALAQIAKEAAATNVAERITEEARASGQTINLSNIQKNIEDLLLGVIQNVGQARIDQPARETLQSQSDFISSEAKASAAESKAAAAASEISAARAQAISEAIRTGGLGREELPQTELPQFDGQIEATIKTEDIDSIRRALQEIPIDEVITPSSFDDVDINTDSDLSDLEASLSPSINELTNSINQLATRAEVTTVGEIPQDQIESFVRPEDIDSITNAINNLSLNQQVDIPQSDINQTIDISELTNQLASAAESSQGTSQSIIEGGSLLQTNIDGLSSATEGFSAGIDQLSAVIDIQREALQNQDTTEIINATSELASINNANTEAVKQAMASIEILNERIAEQIAQAQSPEPIPIEDIQIEGLNEAKDATNSNTETLTSNRQTMESLNEVLSSTRDALAEGISLDLETLQNIQLNITGLEDAFTNLQSDLETLFRNAAQEQIRIALRDVAARLGNTELSQAFENSANA